MSPEEESDLSKKLTLVVDATYFRKRKDKDGLLIFLNVRKKQIVWFKFIASETKENYQEGIEFLISQGFVIEAVTIDGRLGIRQLFESYGILVQLCQFHIQRKISILLTQHPKSQAGKELKQINDLFIKNDFTEVEFGKTLARYMRRNLTYLLEKVESEIDNTNSINNQENSKKPKPKYKHQRLIKALKSYKRNLPYLFTFKKYPNLFIPRTTNDLDAGVNTKLKDLVRSHKGMNLQRRNKLISNLLCNLGKK